MSNFQPYYIFDKDPLILNKSLNVKVLPEKLLKESTKVKILFHHKRKFNFNFDIRLDTQEEDLYLGLHLLAINSKIKAIQIKNVNIPSFCIRAGGSNNNLTLVPEKSCFDINTKISYDDKKLSCVVGHLFNFNYFYADIKFEYGDWSIEIS